MKIGILCHNSMGGSAHIALNLAEELAEYGHALHLFTYAMPFGDWGNIQKSNATGFTRSPI